MHHGDPEGDIVGSYSGDRICEGKPIRSPFSWRGGMWVCVSTWGDLASAYRLTPLASYAPPEARARIPSLFEAARAVAQTIPNCRFVPFAGVGHVPHLEAAEQFEKTVLGFLS